MGRLSFIRRSPWRIVAPAVGLVLLGLAVYGIWQPGVTVTDGRNDRGRNAIYLQHGWLGHDIWFTQNDRTGRKPFFRDRRNIRELADKLRQHHITDLYPHLCPALSSGRIAPWDAEQVERFLDETEAMRVIPWVGGPWLGSASPESPSWREEFAASAAKLLREHPRLAGIHVNIEPCPSGNPHFLALLEEVRASLPEGKLLSVAAYPPPTIRQPSRDVHWEEDYCREVARRADQIVVMAYDTGIGQKKFYQKLVSDWTREALDWCAPTPVLMAMPAYEDAGVDYHDPDVENLPTAMKGLHAGIADYPSLPANYQGIAIYSEWTMDEEEWRCLRELFLAR